MPRLDDALSKAVGGASATALKKAFGMVTVEDLLRHYPRRYAQRGELTDISSLQIDEHVTVMAEVKDVSSRRMLERKGLLVEVTVTDGRGDLKLTFFNQPWLADKLKPGRRGLFSGKVTEFRHVRQLTQPDHVLLPDDGDEVDSDSVAAFARALIPVYSATSSVSSWRIARAVSAVLDGLEVDEADDPLPVSVRTGRGLRALGDALVAVHRPDTLDDVTGGRERLQWDEAFVLQVVLAQRRLEARALPAVPRPAQAGGLLEQFDAALPFTLTAGQCAVGEVLSTDLARSHPMHRLLQGEVGSGKTVCALRAMLAVVDSGGQAALLAPTEVLAAQHARSITAMLGPLAQGGLLGGSVDGTRVALLTGSQNTAQRRASLLNIVSGDAGIVIGTHALLQESVEFYDLGLVVVDEQHRFGVEQRAALAAKSRDGNRPHVLVMTATPIPRTVAMTVFGDLEVSTLDELPAGRSPIATHVVAPQENPAHLSRAWQRIREEVDAGHQAYVVCPRIGEAAGDDDAEAPADDSETERRPPLAVLDVAPRLVQGPLAGLRVGVLHGRLPADEKDDIMRRFAEGGAAADGIDVLVATTVIEVGVDVANATVMVVMDADRFGVSQLHQLRGRVGRGSAPGLCLLVSDSPEGSPARERLAAVAATTDGFELSRIDLMARREGDVLGASQSGRRSSLRLLSVLRDEAVIVAARDVATEVVATDPTLAGQPALRRAVSALVDEEQAEFLERS